MNFLKGFKNFISVLFLSFLLFSLTSVQAEPQKNLPDIKWQEVALVLAVTLSADAHGSVEYRPAIRECKLVKIPNKNAYNPVEMSALTSGNFSK